MVLKCGSSGKRKKSLATWLAARGVIVIPNITVMFVVLFLVPPFFPKSFLPPFWKERRWKGVEAAQQQCTSSKCTLEVHTQYYGGRRRRMEGAGKMKECHETVTPDEDKVERGKRTSAKKLRERERTFQIREREWKKELRRESNW